MKLIDKYLKDRRIKKVEIKGWEECGDFDGADPRPLINVEKKDNLSEYEEDNPVPSLDNFNKEEINCLIESIRYNFDNNEDSDSDSKLEDQIINKLQNGVETNKEQPNKEEIKAIQQLLLNRATEKDASIVEAYLNKFGEGVFS